ncbi:transcription antitermination protein NusG [compost metagenome]
MDGRPSPVPEDYVMNVKKQLGTLTEDDKVTVEFKGKIGDTIRVKNHTMNGLEAEITDVNREKEVVKANLISNGFKLELKFDQIELVEP